MTIPPLPSGALTNVQFRLPVLTAPVSTGVPPLNTDDDVSWPGGGPAPLAESASRGDAPITLAGRLEAGDTLPDTTELALAIESATRSLQHGRADQVLMELDRVWSQQLASDSPWYLRTAALQLLGRTSDAEQVLRDAIARLPRSAAMLYLLGVHTAHRGQHDAARLANDHALALHPTEPLLWLQRAALAENELMHGTAAAMLEHVKTLDPALAASQWLATLARLGERTSRAATPAMQRVIARLTPGSLPTIGDPLLAPPAAAPPAPSLLETALRYGLTLLESPTQSARTATRGGESSETAYASATRLAAAEVHPTARLTLPTLESLVLVGGLLVMVFVPTLRIPALMLTGAVAMLLVSRTLR